MSVRMERKSQICFLCFLAVPKTVTRRCSVKEVFSKILQTQKKSPVPETSACNFEKRDCKKRLTQVFSRSFTKFLRTPFLQKTSGRLLLKTLLRQRPVFKITFKRQKKAIKIA